MLIVQWRPISKEEEIPPFGEQLKKHLESRNSVVRHASCSAWNLLYKVMQDNSLPIEDVSFTNTGKPYFPESDIFFSLSHSHGLCAVAISDKLVGVDVEVIKEKYSSHLIERSLSDEERVLFDGDFTRLWCRKEAVVKMIGCGLDGFPDKINSLEFDFIEQKIYYLRRYYWLTTTVNDGSHIRDIGEFWSKKKEIVL